jgi:hypothetical protein
LSAGAFRFAALSQQNPIAAITRLATLYSQTTYSEKAKNKENHRQSNSPT